MCTILELLSVLMYTDQTIGIFMSVCCHPHVQVQFMEARRLQDGEELKILEFSHKVRHTSFSLSICVCVCILIRNQVVISLKL